MAESVSEQVNCLWGRLQRLAGVSNGRRTLDSMCDARGDDHRQRMKMSDHT